MGPSTKSDYLMLPNLTLNLAPNLSPNLALTPLHLHLHLTPTLTLSAPVHIVMIST